VSAERLAFDHKAAPARRCCCTGCTRPSYCCMASA